MMTEKKVTISILSIVVLSALMWVLLPLKEPPRLPRLDDNTPDAYMNDVVAKIMDKNGNISMTIVTPTLTHFPLDDTTEFNQPILTLFHQSPEPWHITANHAKARDGITKVDFDHDVVINHAADKMNPETTIKTNSLQVNINDELADTNDPITLIQPNITVHAKGMHANMNTGDIKLLAEARGEYVSTH